jgi:hypothetical protein
MGKKNKNKKKRKPDPQAVKLWGRSKLDFFQVSSRDEDKQASQPAR